jgi:RNA polymerase sigma-54 factor
MAIELRQQLKLSQQLIMTPQLQMAIKLLQLSRLELMDTIAQELEENPALEEVQEALPEESPAEEAAESKPEEKEQPLEEVTIQEKIHDDVDWNNYIDEYNSPGRINFETESREAPRFESFISGKKTLGDHLLWQLLMTSPDADTERIGSLIIGNIDRDGYLDASVEELTVAAGLPRRKSSRCCS